MNTSVMDVRKPHRGASLLEVMIVLSVIVTLAVIVLPAYSTTRLSVYEAQCQTQLAEIYTAILRYRDHNRGLDPPHLQMLAPTYIKHEQLVCPILRARASSIVSRLQELSRPTVYRSWASYIFYRRRGIDSAHSAGVIPCSYTEAFNKRHGDTPLAACRDHREPQSIWEYVSADTKRSWYEPDRPILVLRVDGRVNRSYFGGLEADNLRPGTCADLFNL